MKFLPLLLANLRRKKLRTLLTVGSFIVALFLFGFLAIIHGAFSGGVDLVGIDRLMVINKVSIIQPLPLSYKDQIQRIPGVKYVTYQSWFGGIYQDPKNFFPSFAVDPDTQRLVFPELVVPDDQWNNFVADREGAIVGKRTADRFHWKVGDRIPLTAPIYGTGTWEFNIRGIYDSPREGIDLTQFWLQKQYLEERRTFGKGQTGWYTVKLDSSDDSSRVIKTIDDQFANQNRNPRRHGRVLGQASRQHRILDHGHRCGRFLHPAAGHRQHHVARDPRTPGRTRGHESRRLF
jgi:putative ABC transport system permease protein